jgi:hypothetical protein
MFYHSKLLILAYPANKIINNKKPFAMKCILQITGKNFSKHKEAKKTWPHLTAQIIMIKNTYIFLYLEKST